MAKPLINYQREFLLEYFFKNESCPGWRDIAIKLLNTGQCIVPGKDKLWQGGIGNFIKTSIEPDMIGCLLYKFDLNIFLTSNWYKQIKEQYLFQLLEKKTRLEQEIIDITNLI